MSDIKTLAERLETAKGPDRELDLLIFLWANDCTNYLPPTLKQGTWQATATWRGHTIRPFAHESEAGRWTEVPMCPCNVAGFTASIDAALALVERLLPGWALDKLAQYHENDRKVDLWGCVLLELLPYHEHLRLGQQDPRRRARADAPTPALAILRSLVAALIAKEAGNV